MQAPAKYELLIKIAKALGLMVPMALRVRGNGVVNYLLAECFSGAGQ